MAFSGDRHAARDRSTPDHGCWQPMSALPRRETAVTAGIRITRTLSLTLKLLWIVKLWEKGRLRR